MLRGFERFALRMTSFSAVIGHALAFFLFCATNFKIM
jgi:hypothetical protein